MNFFSAFFSKKNKASQSGLTMIEFLIVIVIVAILLILFFMRAGTHIGRSRDAERKSDLQKIKTAFEDYYNDNECYPPAGSLNNCDGTSLSPYLSEIPCDPVTDEPYRYYALDNDICSGYRVLAKLDDETDPSAERMNCDEESGCDPGAPGYSYGVGNGGQLEDYSVWTFYGNAVNMFICRESDAATGHCAYYDSVPDGCVGFTEGAVCDAQCYEGSSSVCIGE